MKHKIKVLIFCPHLTFKVNVSKKRNMPPVTSLQCRAKDEMSLKIHVSTRFLVDRYLTGLISQHHISLKGEKCE